MARRRRMQPRPLVRAGARPEIGNGQENEPVNVSETQDAGAQEGGAQEAVSHAIENAVEPQPGPVDAPAASIHATLLEGVSTDAMVARGFGEPDAAPPSEPDVPDGSDAIEPEATDAVHWQRTEFEPGAPTPGEDLTILPEVEAERIPFAAEIVEATRASLDAAAYPLAALPSVAQGAHAPIPALPIPMPLPMPLPVPLPALGKVTDLAASPRIAQAMGELGEVNDTVLTYLRGEGNAALAHWQALAGARTPAEAIRLQVDEMQRAADASLSCIAAIARRAGRLTSVIGRP